MKLFINNTIIQDTNYLFKFWGMVQMFESPRFNYYYPLRVVSSNSPQFYEIENVSLQMASTIQFEIIQYRHQLLNRTDNSYSS